MKKKKRETPKVDDSSRSTASSENDRTSDLPDLKIFTTSIHLGGDFICCEQCPSTFHLGCMEMKALPEEWYCCICWNVLYVAEPIISNALANMKICI